MDFGVILAQCGISFSYMVMDSALVIPFIPVATNIEYYTLTVHKAAISNMVIWYVYLQGAGPVC